MFRDRSLSSTRLTGEPGNNNVPPLRGCSLLEDERHQERSHRRQVCIETLVTLTVYESVAKYPHVAHPALENFRKGACDLFER